MAFSNANAIKPWASNPRYWQYKGNPLMLIGGSDDDNLFQIPNLQAHLDDMVGVGANVVRCTMSDRVVEGFEVKAFLWLSGQNKYDLNQWNNTYWTRFNNLVTWADQRDIIVQIEVWDRFDYSQANWTTSPYNPANNINYTTAQSGLATSYPNHPALDEQPFFHTQPANDDNTFLRAYQENFVDKMLSYTLDHPNILYCMNNETSSAESWGQYWMAYIKTAATAEGVTVYTTDMFHDPDITTSQHTTMYNNPSLYTFVDISQNNGHHHTGTTHWSRLTHANNQVNGLRPINTTKCYLADTHLAPQWFQNEARRNGDIVGIDSMIMNVLGGLASTRFHRPPSGLGLTTKAKNAIKALRLLEGIIPFWDLSPRDDLLTNNGVVNPSLPNVNLGTAHQEAHLAAQPGEKYALYFFQGGSIGLKLGSYAGQNFDVQWINVATGNLGSTSTIAGGSTVTINAPTNSQHWLAAITRDTSIPPPPPPPPQGNHPRLHITASGPADSRPSYFRSKIQANYTNEFQNIVSECDSKFNNNVVMGLEAGQVHAFVYAIGSVTGIVYQRSINEYADRAITILMNITNGALYTSGKTYSVQEDMLSAVARTYDWCFNRMTNAQRNTCANWLADSALANLNAKGLSNGDNSSLWSSNAFESPHVWYVGLVLEGDGFRDADATTLKNYFNQSHLSGGYLDAQNWLSRTNGGVSELGAYGFWHPLRTVISLDGWRTATGTDYATTATALTAPTWFKNYTKYVLYRTPSDGKVNPSRPGGREYRVLKAGQAEADSMASNFFRLKRALHAWGEPLKRINSQESRIARWYIENRSGVSGNTEYDNWLDVLWGDKTVQAKSPAQENLPLSIFFAGMGHYVYRTGFDDGDDTYISVLAPPYQLSGHDWGPWTITPAGFIIHKFGILAHVGRAEQRGAKNFRKNIMRFTDPANPIDGGFRNLSQSPTDYRDYTPTAEQYIGGMKHVQIANKFDYLQMDYTKYYLSSRVNSYVRQMLILKSTAVADSDYIVCFDRTQCPQANMIKRWAINCAYNPTISGSESQLRDGFWEYTGNPNSITISNSGADPQNGIDYEGHGKLFLKTLLPSNRKITKLGGDGAQGTANGHQFEHDDGVWQGYQGENGDWATMQAVGQYHCAGFSIELLSTQNNANENFLVVMQTAESATPSMAAANLITNTGLQGCQIAKTTGQDEWVCIFSDSEALISSGSYTVSKISNSQHHVIANLQPGSSVAMTKDAVSMGNFTASNQGTIEFTVQATANHTYGINSSGTVGATVNIESASTDSLPPDVTVRILSSSVTLDDAVTVSALPDATFFSSTVLTLDTATVQSFVPDATVIETGLRVTMLGTQTTSSLPDANAAINAEFFIEPAEITSFDSDATVVITASVNLDDAVVKSSLPQASASAGSNVAVEFAETTSHPPEATHRPSVRVNVQWSRVKSWLSNVSADTGWATAIESAATTSLLPDADGRIGVFVDVEPDTALTSSQPADTSILIEEDKIELVIAVRRKGRKIEYIVNDL